MTSINSTRGKYPGIAWKEPMTEKMMLPDAVLDAQRAVVEPLVGGIYARHVKLDRHGGVVPPLNRHRLLWPVPAIDWARSCELVCAAFDWHDAQLGERVRSLLSDGTRVVRKETPTGDCAAYTVPKGWQGRAEAQIMFESDGTVSDPVYLAHELGHLLSFVLAEEAGVTDLMMPRHAIEVPAFYCQVMFYDFLSRQGDETLRRAGLAHAAGELTRSLYGQTAAYAAQGIEKAGESPVYQARMAELLGADWNYFKAVGRGAFAAYDLHTYATAPLLALGLYDGAACTPALFDAIFLRGAETDILEILSAAGVTQDAELTPFFARALGRAAAPLAAIEAAA